MLQGTTKYTPPTLPPMYPTQRPTNAQHNAVLVYVLNEVKRLLGNGGRNVLPLVNPTVVAGLFGEWCELYENTFTSESDEETWACEGLKEDWVDNFKGYVIGCVCIALGYEPTPTLTTLT